MMTDKRKIAAFILGIIMMIPLASCLLLSARQYSIRHRMKEKLETEITHTVIIPEKDINWIEKDKELIINGKMFDVKQLVHQNNGNIRLTGLFDNDETNLVKEIKDKQERSQSNNYSQLFSFLQSARVLPSEIKGCEITAGSEASTRSSFTAGFLQNGYSGVSTPPPRC